MALLKYIKFSYVVCHYIINGRKQAKGVRNMIIRTVFAPNKNAQR